MLIGLQIAHQLIKTLIVLKLNGVVHREINTKNILVEFDKHENEDEIRKLNINLTNFGWARAIFENDEDIYGYNRCPQSGGDNQGRIAPEIMGRFIWMQKIKRSQLKLANSVS